MATAAVLRMRTMARPLSCSAATAMHSKITSRLFRNLKTSALCHCRSQVDVREENSSLGEEEEEFRVLEIPGFNKFHKDREWTTHKSRMEVNAARYKSMHVDQDWSSVWPAARTFNWSVVPLPVRQGFVDKHENEGIPPGKYANLELMKIPNFFHLSPTHIKQQCAAIKKFCTQWPEELKSDEDCEKHFPIEITTSDYVFDSASIREPMARVVTFKVKLASLKLDSHGKDKLLRLAGPMYDRLQDTLTLVIDRCPSQQQNKDYAYYLFTVLNHEARKFEPWESEKTVDDMEKFIWELMPSKKNLTEALINMQKVAQDSTREEKVPSYIGDLSQDFTESDIDCLETVKEYKNAVSNLHNKGENIQALESYKDSVRKLLIG